MNNVCICLGKYAKNAFFIKFSEISIYSIEELCYYFMENIYVIDSDIMTIELVDWIRSECDLSELAEELTVLVRKKASISLFVIAVFEYTKFYEEQDIKRAARILKEQEFLTPFEKWKKKAEYEYRLGRFHQAQHIYEFLLGQTPIDDISTRALLLYNLGSVFAMDFAFKEAAEYFWESYQLQKSQKTRIAYIIAIKYEKNDFEYGRFQRAHEEWNEEFRIVEKIYQQTQQEWEVSKTYDVINQIKREKKHGQISKYQQMRNDLLFQLKRDFRRQTV